MAGNNSTAQHTRKVLRWSLCVLGTLTVLAPSRPALAYELQGTADLNDPDRLTWILPDDPPILTKCCYKDHDCDHIADWVEAELAWAFRPIFEFDEQESAFLAVGSESVNISSGVVVFYQVTPVKFQLNPVEIVLRIKHIMTYPGDRTRLGSNPVGNDPLR